MSPYRGFVPIADEVLRAAREAARDVVAAIVEQAVERAKPRPRPSLMVDTIDPLVEVARIACRKFDECDFVAMPMDEAARAVGRRVLDLMGCSCVARPEAVRP